MLLHFLLDEGDSLGGDVAAEVVEAGELSEQGEQCVTDSAAQFRKVADCFLLLVQFSEPGDLDHFSFQVGSVSEEVAFVEFVELVPNLLGVGLGLLVLVFRKLRLVLFELL